MNADRFGRRLAADSLYRPPSRTTRNRRGGGKAKRLATPQPCKANTSPASNDYLTLVEEDALYIRLGTKRPSDAVAQLFVDAFRSVWQRIPQADRDLMVRYWQTERPDPEGSIPCPRSRYRPVILLIDTGPLRVEHQCKRNGHELSFCLAPLKRYPEDLPLTIAKNLAFALRCANRSHWKLAIEEIEDPIEEWERRQTKVTEAARNRKLDALEAAFRKKHYRAMAEILGRWSFGGQPPV